MKCEEKTLESRLRSAFLDRSYARLILDVSEPCAKLVDYRDKAGPLGFQLEKADYFIDEIRKSLEEFLDSVHKTEPLP